MSQNIANPGDSLKDFQEKVADQIRAKIADLIPDEVLKQMVEKVVKEDILKAELIPPGYGNGYNTTYKPSPVTTMIKELVEPMVQQYVQEYFQFNKHEIGMLVKQVFEKGVGDLMVSSLARGFNQDFYTFAHLLNERYAREGKPPI